ncbi:hypothetical protein HPP92_018723 [Vanilla planifolia]|uniref:Uncharacterized protein n=1 Tax=Vanilla planifolia TaxID=51239 RepID=A0A835QEZ8_VANPL|nr:hypothetical protein HPP92_018723 [Vanilla planifolia]
MEGRSKPKGGAGGANRMMSLMQKPICSPSKPSEPAPRIPPKPQSLFLRNKVNPTSSEPSSPKVTCAGQVKDRHGKAERRRRRRERKKKNPLKFLSSLRRLQLDAVRCFQCPQVLSHGYTDEEGGEHNEEEENCTPKGIMVSRWFMTAAGENDVGASPPGEAEEVEENFTGKEANSAAMPPPNALSLMRSCSANCPVEKVQLNEANGLSSTL